MKMSRTPLRISFTGGGTDFKDFYEREYGAVISTTINKYIYITLNNYFEKKYILKYSKTEIVENIDDIKHRLIRECLKYVGMKSPVEITAMADVPSGTGLGSSSAFTSGLLKVLLINKSINVDNKLLAQLACDVEIKYLSDPIGKQDQYACAVGGFNIIKFYANKVTINPIKLSENFKSQLNDELLLLYLNKSRKAYKILNEQKNNIKDKFPTLKRMRDISLELKVALETEDIKRFCELMNENWRLKKTLASKISNPYIDSCYETAIRNGALAGKVCGAGSGGFMLFYVPKNKKNKVKEALKLPELDFRFEKGGAKIVYDDR